MDRLILEEKLEALRRCIARIQDKRTETAEALHRDPDRQDVLSLNLTRAGQLCVDLAMHMLAESDRPAPQTMGEAFAALAAQGVIPEALCQRLRAAVGFRNIAIHYYQVINWDIVHAIAHEALRISGRSRGRSTRISTAGNPTEHQRGQFTYTWFK